MPGRLIRLIVLLTIVGVLISGLIVVRRMNNDLIENRLQTKLVN